MKAWIVRVMLAVALIAVGFVWGHTSVTVVHAQITTSVPRAYGHLVLITSGGLLVFEDNVGTLRFSSASGSVSQQINRY